MNQKVKTSLVIGMSFLALTSFNNAKAENPAENGKWDFTMTDIQMITQYRENNHGEFKINIGVLSSGSEKLGSFDTILKIQNNNMDNQRFVKTVYDVKVNEITCIEFDHSRLNLQNNCNFFTAELLVTPPNFNGNHIFDKKTIFYIPCQHGPEELDYSKQSVTEKEQKQVFNPIELHVIPDTLNLAKDNVEFIKISGNILKSEYHGGLITILITDPNEDIESLRIPVTSAGKFETVFRIDRNESPTGNYTFLAKYSDHVSNLTNIEVIKVYHDSDSTR